MKIFKIIIQVAVFILLLVLAINNMQTVEFNFFSVYVLKLPLIITLAIFAVGGLLIGLLYGFVNNLALKSQISKLKKQIDKTEEKVSKVDQII
ncbi:MAG: DUF1049 domain-containing protein [Neisseriales bacterium]|jgi:uncharacterized integral membrane protein|nr:MAG: DUF1049 domain-containing protein [Neisseriales bacterium]HRG61859.1 lipopolysaccharide assembly protein LapA domain-containing protein [Burkholderiales bacterium]